MPNVAIYAATAESISREQLEKLAPGAKVSPKNEAAFQVDWADVSVTINTMPSAEVPHHLDGFCGYVENLADPSDKGIKQLLSRIRGAQLVHGVLIEPAYDPDGKAEHLVNRLLTHYQGLLFARDAVWDEQGKLLIGPAADDLATAADSDWQPTAAQIARVERSKHLLENRKVPMFKGPLYTEDDEEVKLRDSQDVERRVLVLWVVVGKGEGMPHKEAQAMLQRFGVEDAASPAEKEFLQNARPKPDECQAVVWRLEAVEVLMWALGYIKELAWPATFCDVPRLVKLLRPQEQTPAFVGKARLRSKAEILDVLDLTMRQHWAIRDAWLAKKPIPSNLDWAKPGENIAVAACPASGIVEQRHHAFNWLTCLGNADWDDVDTPT